MFQVPTGQSFTPGNFLALPPELSEYRRARVALLPVPYDSTTTFRGGARDGPRAMVEASRHLEDYDPELESEPCRVGIHTLPELEPHLGNPAEMVQRISKVVEALAADGKLVGTLGGEHTVAVGAVMGLKARYPDLSVVYLDAHADLRDSYMGTPYSHACTARRIQELCPIRQAGIRSLSLEEADFLKAHPGTAFLWDSERRLGRLPETLAQSLGHHLYISVDLDVLDPSVMAAVGTPEPGGMLWHELLALVRAVSGGRRMIGFDVTELAPSEGPTACALMAAKLVYKLIGYATVQG
jgi:agmatinase